MIKNRENSVFCIFLPQITENNRMKKRKKKFQSKTDPLGSYTGVPQNPHDLPQQDADDL